LYRSDLWFDVLEYSDYEFKLDSVLWFVQKVWLSINIKES